MKKIYLSITILLFSILVSNLSNAQSETFVFESSDCNFIKDFNISNEGFTTPSIYSDDNDVSFFWNSAAGAFIESSGLTTRGGSLISPVFLNNLNGEAIVGFTFAAPAGAEYRIRIIRDAPLAILATTANGPVWTSLPSASGTICLRLLDADLAFGTSIRYEFSFRATQATDMLFDNFALSSANIPLPVAFMGFVARKNDNGTTNLLWDVGEEINVNSYRVERSLNGTDFTGIGSVTASGKKTYSFEDNQPVNGIRYYRVKNIDIDGQSKYTPIIKVSGKKRSGQIQLYPVPAKDQVYVQHESAPAKATITIYGFDGRAIKQVQTIPNTFQTFIDISNLKSGMYLIKYNDGKGDIQSAKLIKQ